MAANSDRWDTGGAPFGSTTSRLGPTPSYAPRADSAVLMGFAVPPAIHNGGAYRGLTIPRHGPGITPQMTAPNDDALPALDKEQDDDAWKSIIPGGVTPQEYAAVSPPQSPQPVRREM
ncbi:hypothetical protein AURDEDRAFT_178742 [Auricularia subglabra TFB-10046 SS5]|uniref:Uncharacterized protein n=1 Tax=Auricularia subglabra (strain TFB-10046 / SS5) TaxID=717982 RepID=J0CPV5_AURST|nr:hypothetical protein AURDEDRAFT_178742 [Auricularia subglabra TFB-10046 SS5]